MWLKLLKQLNPALAGPLVYFKATVAQMQGRDTSNQQVGFSNPNI